METIKELIQVIEKSRFRQINVLGYGHDENATRLNEFYKYLVRGKLNDDEAAAAHFFQSPPSDLAYRKLKSRLKARLLNTLFFLNVKQSNYREASRAYLTCLKEVYAVRILLHRGAVHTAMGIACRILRQSTFFEFTELSLEVAKMLRTVYATRIPNPKKFAYYHALTRTLGRQLDLETQAQGYYLLLATNFTHSRASSQKVVRQAHEFIQALQYEEKEKRTFYFQRYYLQILTLIAMCRNDYRKAIQIASEALEWIETMPFNASSVKTFFHFQIIACCTYLREYEEGLKVAEKNLAQENDGSLNWFKNRELSFVMALHTGNYQEAYLIYLQVVGHQEFKRMEESNAEQWKIFEAYIMYLKVIGKVETDPREAGNNFRLSKFLNEVPIFSRDKQGMNIPILILQILFTIANRRYEMAMERIVAIKKYCTRYLYNDDTYRSNVFIRMLLGIPEVGFHRHAVMRQAQPWLERLQGMPLELAQKGRHFEVIPYETLWAMALESLHPKIYPMARIGKSPLKPMLQVQDSNQSSDSVNDEAPKAG